MANEKSMASQSSLSRNNAIPADQASETSQTPLVGYVDTQCLSRDCVGEQLATRMLEWLIKPMQGAAELQDKDGRSRASLVILHIHGASVSDAAVVDQMAIIGEAAPGVPLILLSDLDEADEVRQAMQLGVHGYLPTNLPIPQIIGAIRLVGAGGTYIPICALAASREARQPSPCPPMDGAGNAIGFSPRQLQVLELLHQGEQNRAIAYELNMCESTVKVHVRHIMKKLNARSRTQVVLLTRAYAKLETAEAGSIIRVDFGASADPAHRRTEVP